MRRALTAILSALVVASLSASATFAGNVHFSGGVSFSLGSLISSGVLVGLGMEDVRVTLDATGIPLVACTNSGGNLAPGQNPPKVSASGSQFLVHTDYEKNGISPFNVETQQPQPGLTAEQLGCPNNNWTAEIVFVYWTDAVITVSDANTGAILLQQHFACTTTITSVTCTPTT